MNHVAIFLADGFEEIEAFTPIDVLRRADIKVTSVSITNKLEVVGAHQIKTIADKKFDEVNFDDISCIVLPGGIPGANNLEKHKLLNEVLINFSETGKLLAAICAAPMILGKLGLTKDKNATCYPGFEKYLPNTIHINEATVLDSNLLTGKAAGASMTFALHLVEILKDKETADMIAKKMFVPE